VVNARSLADWGQVPMFLLLKKAKIFLMKNYRQTSSVTSMISQLGWEELRLIRTRIKTILLFKIVYNLLIYHQNRSSFQLAQSLEVKQEQKRKGTSSMYWCVGNPPGKSCLPVA
jgi:hypothetical protein